ncbi:hypothetical protein DXG03_004473 [Asterophora parasitica]|uniref:Uncharacterized protein n=1 Tax=Asterophora parasitica TaxID=117018 RepID=A0A9P7KEM6_9AGAR|nr:hypothetical protein DXG03_004473 [Asterophora parasitica]
MITILATSRLSAVRASFINARTRHSTPVAAKTVTEKVSEVADKVNKKVGKRLASAIETGEQATQSAKETLGSATEETKETAENASDLAKQKTNQVRSFATHWRPTAHGNHQAAAGAHEAKEDIEKEAKK